MLTKELFEGMKALVFKKEALCDAVMLCCWKRDARVWSLAKLKGLAKMARMSPTLLWTGMVIRSA